MHYPIVIHKDRRSDYGVTVPDLPGCFSAGSTLDEAIAMAREAIELHIEGLIEEGQPVPRAGRVEDHARDPANTGGTWAVVSIDASRLRTNAKRINITIPERVLDQVDRFARQTGDTRSGCLAKAVTEYVRQSKPKHGPSEKARTRRRAAARRK